MPKALFVLFASILFSPVFVKAQEGKPVLNHMAFYVKDLARSTDFYMNFIGLDSIPEPFHDGRHTWLSIGPKSHLHLIAGSKGNIVRDKNTHLCFSVPNVPAFVAKLEKAGIPYEDWAGKKQSITHRVDGVKQLYLEDPDGYWIEINDARQ